MDRSYYPLWTDQVYTVAKSIKGHQVPMYQIMNKRGRVLTQRFYPQEIQQITSADREYCVKVLRERITPRGHKEYFVHWIGYPDSYNSWVSDVRRLSHGK